MKYLAMQAVGPLEDPAAQPPETSPETPSATPPQPRESCAKVAESCAKVAPVTRTELSKHFGVSRTAISDWLAAIERVMDCCAAPDPLYDDKNRVTSFAQRELDDYRAMGAEAYERDRRARYGAIAPSAPPQSAIVRSVSTAAANDDAWSALKEVVDVTFEDVAPPDAGELLFVQALREETEQIGLAIDKTRQQTDMLLQSRRRIRRRNIAEMARRDAAEDVAVYDRSYRDELAKRGVS